MALGSAVQILPLDQLVAEAGVRSVVRVAVDPGEDGPAGLAAGRAPVPVRDFTLERWPDASAAAVSQCTAVRTGDWTISISASCLR